MNNENRGLMKALKIGGIFVLIVGIVIAGRWFMHPGAPFSFAASENSAGTATVAVLKGDVQEVAIDLQSGAYAPIMVQKGIPVRFNIRAEKENINSCNGTVVIPEYNLQATLKPGDNILEFTPDKTGVIPYSCWMNMITSSIQVVDDLSKADPSVAPAAAAGSGALMPCCRPQ